MTSKDVLEKIVPAEEQVVLIHEDWKAKLISNTFAKMLRSVHFNDQVELNPNSESELQATTQAIFRSKCQVFCEMLTKLTQLPYHQFWSTAIYNRQAIEPIFEYLSLMNDHPEYDEIISKEELGQIKNLVYEFFFRLFYPKENGDDSLSQSYHDNMLMKYFNNFKNLCNFLYFFRCLDPDFINVITSFINRNEKWFRPNLEKLRDDLYKKISEFQLQQTNMRQEFIDIVKELWYIGKFNSLIQNNPDLNKIFVDNNIIEALLKFYCFFMAGYRSYIQVFKSKNISDPDENWIELFQITLMAIFISYFDKVVLEDLRISLSKTNNELFQSLESFDLKMKVLFTEYQQFIVDFFHYFKFEQVFCLFYGEQLRRIIKPEASLLNYRTALKEAEENYSFSNLWWSKNDFENLSSLDSQPNSGTEPKKTDVEEPKVPENAADIPEKKFEHLKLSDDVVSKFKTMNDVLGSGNFGEGYLYLCLEYYGFDSEKAINAILEDILPPDLKSRSVDSTLAEANDFKKSEASKPNRNVGQMYIGKKDKVNSILREEKGDLHKRILGLNDMMEEMDEAKIAEMRRLIERGSDLEELQKNEEFFGLSIYNDECDDTYEKEDISIENWSTAEMDNRGNFDQGTNLIHSNDNNQQNIQNVNRQNFNHTLPNRNQWKEEQDEDDEDGNNNDGAKSFDKRTNFIPNEKFSNAAQYRKNQFRNKKNFNQRNANANSAAQNSQSQQQNSQANRNNNNQQNKGQNNDNQAGKKGNNRGRGGSNNRGNNQGNMNNTKRPNHETASAVNPNKRK